MQAIGHPVVGDTLYGAPARVKPVGAGAGARKASAPMDEGEGSGFALDRNFLHAAELEFVHPRTGKKLELSAGLPEELVEVLERVRGAS